MHKRTCTIILTVFMFLFSLTLTHASFAMTRSANIDIIVGGDVIKEEFEKIFHQVKTLHQEIKYSILDKNIDDDLLTLNYEENRLYVLLIIDWEKFKLDLSPYNKMAGILKNMPKKHDFLVNVLITNCKGSLDSILEEISHHFSTYDIRLANNSMFHMSKTFDDVDSISSEDLTGLKTFKSHMYSWLY